MMLVGFLHPLLATTAYERTYMAKMSTTFELTLQEKATLTRFGDRYGSRLPKEATPVTLALLLTCVLEQVRRDLDRKEHQECLDPDWIEF